ncbi:MAG TPA: hypothetical protein VNN18_05475 [Candidatus Xenobia bacterium]|nr:hypothetical protein [Candidatus Xenobia bacterium]
MTAFEDIWNEIIRHAGEEFYELAGRRFTYTADAGSLQPSTHEHAIPKAHFQRAWASGLLGNLRHLRQQFGQREHSYIFSILTDPRLKND